MPSSPPPPFKVVIAGAGIGGLVLAVGLLKRGFEVTVLERDMTAIRGEGKYRGPIQVRALTPLLLLLVAAERMRSCALSCRTPPALQLGPSQCNAPARPPACPPSHPTPLAPLPRCCLHAQIQSNALAALEALDKGVVQRVFEEGCITGDRINGLCDGVTGDWYVKFDTFHPAADMGLPVTRVISRVLLQVGGCG